MSTIAIPALSHSVSGHQNSVYLYFARADGTQPMFLSIGYLGHWAYAFAPYKYTHSGAIVKCRLACNGYGGWSYGSWATIDDVAAGVWWITGLNISAFSYNSNTGAVSIAVSAGAFTDSISSVDVDALSDTETDLPLHHLVTAGAEGREITKLRYRLNQDNAGAGAWLGTPTGEAIIRRFAT